MRRNLMITIQVLPSFGRSVIAERDIKSDTLIEVAEILVLSADDTISVNKTGLKDYTFTYNDTQDCLVMGIGEMFNHSDTPNVSYELLHVNRVRMHFRTLRDIKKGEQLFIDYNADVHNSIDFESHYKTNLM